MTPLQSILDAWADAIASQHGTTKHFVTAFNYADHDTLDDYHGYQCIVTQYAPSFANVTTPADSQLNGFSGSFSNDGSTVLQKKIDFTTKNTESYTLEVTDALAIGIEASVTMGVPALISSTIKTTVNLTLTRKESKMITEEQTWTTSSTINIPPRTTTTVTQVINLRNSDVAWTTPISIRGHVAVWFEDRIFLNGSPTDHHLWFFPIGVVVRQTQSASYHSVEGYSIINDGEIHANVDGKVTGQRGISESVRVVEGPLQPATRQVPGAIPSDAAERKRHGKR